LVTNAEKIDLFIAELCIVKNSKFIRMKKKILFIVCLAITSMGMYAQSESMQVNLTPKPNDSLISKPVVKIHSKSYEVKSAIEVESLVPMFLTGAIILQ